MTLLERGDGDRHRLLVLGDPMREHVALPVIAAMSLAISALLVSAVLKSSRSLQ
jgi:hypothetical protein